MTTTSTTRPSREPVLTLGVKPEFSLAPGVIKWCHTYIRQPDGPEAGGPWRFTKEQARFLWYYYGVDKRGRFVWSRATLRRAKGWGKSPFAAAIALAELCGPVRFSHFSGGKAIGKPVAMPWVQVAGVSEKQTDNTMSMILGMVHESPIIADYDLDVGLTRILMPGGGKLEPITASAKTAEGARPTFVILDETHLWHAANGGHKLAEVIRRNLGKSRDGAARSIETTNAYEMGTFSVAERTYKAWQSQVAANAERGGRVTILYDSREAPADVDLVNEEDLNTCLAVTYGDSEWVDFERLMDEIYDPSNPVAESRRFYLNQLVAGEDSWLSPQEWDRIADKTKIILPEDECTLGFDGSKNDDHCALIKCRISDGHIQTVGIWNPENWGGEAPRGEIELAISLEMATGNIVGFYSDVKEWESYVQKWSQEYGEDLSVKATPKNAVGFDMRGNKLATVQMIEDFHDGVVEEQFTHDGNPVLAQHVYNAKRNSNQYGTGIQKEAHDSPNKIDGAVAAALARKARQDYLALPPSKRRKKKTGEAVFV